MTDAVTFGNQKGEAADAPEHAPPAPNDPSRPDATPPAAAPPANPAAAPDAEAAPQRNSREEIAARFQRQRSEHQEQFGKVDHVPFVERQEEEARQAAERQPPAEPAPPAAAPPEGQQPPAPAAPSYTLKVRGKDISVASRDELLRLAEVEAHEANEFTDAQLTKLAQKHVAALSYIDEGKAFRDQARVAAPAPAGQPAGDQQQQPSQQQPQAPSLAELRAKAIERTQMGDAEDAAAAWRAYEDARDAERQRSMDAQSQERDWRNAAARDVATFGEANQDIVGDSARGDLLLMTATREMESDLRACGLTDEHLHAALNNPGKMTELFGYARQSGMSVRTNAQLLEAAGAKVRQAFGMPAPAAPAQAPTPPAVQTRSDEKRGLQAQPLRSGNPQPVTPPPPDPQKSRSAAVAAMQEGRRGNNIRQYAG